MSEMGELVDSGAVVVHATSSDVVPVGGAMNTFLHLHVVAVVKLVGIALNTCFVDRFCIGLLCFALVFIVDSCESTSNPGDACRYQTQARR